MKTLGWSSIVGALALSACGGTGEVGKTYARIVEATYADSVAQAKSLDTAITAFVAGPTAATHTAAKNAWLASREPYLQSEVFRFYDGPIDAPETGPEGLINAWPLDEAYIDYVEGNADAGVVNNPSVTITAAGLEALNEQGGEQNIATGFHAIEFLLWGQDQSDTGPGARSHTDYLTTNGTAKNQQRRGQYLSIASGMLHGHLESMQAAWAPTATYRKEFEAAAESEQLRRILTGMIILSGFETGGERLQTALDSGDQEDEHSCFSDNTHRDMIQDIQGVLNVYRGTYTKVDGTTISGASLKDVVAAKDSELAKRLDDEIAASLAAAKALTPPFDREIATSNAAGRMRVQALITALRKQEKTLEEVFRKLGLTVPPQPT